MYKPTNLFVFILSTHLFLFCTHLYSQANEKELLKKIYLIPSGNQKKIKELTIILNDCKQNGYNDGTALAYMKIAEQYRLKNNIDEALKYYNLIDKEKLFNNQSNIKIYSECKNGQAEFYATLGFFDRATKILDSIDHRIENYPNLQSNILLTRRYIFAMSGQNKQEFLTIKKAYLKSKLYRKTQQKNQLINHLEYDISYFPSIYLADAYLTNSKLDSAKIYIEEVQNDINLIENKAVKLTFYVTAANIYIEENKFIEAKRKLEKAMLFSEDLGNQYSTKKMILTSYLNLYEGLDIKDSISFYSKSIIDLDKEYEISKNLLRNKIDSNKEGIESHNSSRMLIILIIVGLFLLLIYFLYFMIFKNNQQSKKEKLDRQEIELTYTPLFDKVIELAKQNDPEFMVLFNSLYPNFIKVLLEENPDLKNTELNFCAYIYLNFSTKDIARYTNIAIRTVQTKKYKLRKKLNIPSEVDLYIWFSNLNEKMDLLDL